jgi:hypothetical protein
VTPNQQQQRLMVACLARGGTTALQAQHNTVPGIGGLSAQLLKHG